MTGITWREDRLRPPIEASWQRSRQAGVDPARALDTVDHREVDVAGHLLRAARPVLDDLHAQLGADTGLNSLLVDATGRVLQRWCGTRASAGIFDNLRIDAGATVLEEMIGTNAPGTVLETRSPVAVHGREHFAVPLQAFSCVGQPIVHPVTHRMEGVLDFTVVASEADELLGPLLSRTVADIEQRLLDGSRSSSQRLLTAFQSAAVRRRAVVAVGEDLLLTNQVAADLLTTADLTVLRILVQDLSRQRSNHTTIALESGRRVDVEGTLVDNTGGGAVLTVRPVAEPTRPVPRGRRSRNPSPDAPLLIAGAAGTGRSTAARERAVAPTTLLSAADALLDPATWASGFAAAVRDGRGTIVVDGVDLLPVAMADLVGKHARAAAPPRLMLISGPVSGLSGPASALAALCPRRHELVPLAARLSDLPAIITRMLRELGADRSLHLAPSALEALSGHPWPGNLSELRSVLATVAAGHRTGGITSGDLPPDYRVPGPSRSLRPIDRAERDVIISALRSAGGNKVKAAHLVGISRTTLYAKLRTLGITSY